jgi:hypothetical protein
MAPRANWKGGSTEQLRRDIDSGRTGDKVDWPDPAMAPLGTDDEAAGTPPSRERVRLARRQELSRGPKVPINVAKLDAPTRFYFVFIVALGLVFILAGLIGARP